MSLSAIFSVPTFDCLSQETSHISRLQLSILLVPHSRSVSLWLCEGVGIISHIGLELESGFLTFVLC